ncbi:MAG: M1 family metallopeptidase, partial [Thermoplasmata archaeon]
MSHDPPTVRVREYRLALVVDVAELRFHGTVEIDVEGLGPTLTLDAVGLEIETARSGQGPLTVTYAPEREEIVLDGFTEAIGTAVLDFRGKVAEKGMVGLYRSRFGDGTILTTQCAPTGARRVFPCIDRPDAKAPIALDLTVGLHDGVIFNTPVIEQRTRGTRKRLKFDPTPPMAPYLFYLGIGPFEELRGKASRVRLSVATPPGRSDEGEFALERTTRILPAYEEYFQIPYPLAKLDLVAVPELAFAAMENWGAIAFREMRLLIGDDATSGQRRDALTTITHELAHQWFGNLVTMGWWTDIWLNESFATFLEPKMIERLFPGSGALDEFVLGWTSPALFGDSLPSTHPVESEVERVDEIAQIFDEISYGKGASVLRMVEGFLGEETFRQGVTAYLTKFRYGNARSDDLWTTLEGAAGRPVRDLLNAWVRRPGLPVVRANFEGSRLHLVQQRFSLVGGSGPQDPWPIPMLVEADGEMRRVLFDTPEVDLDVVDPGSVHLNPGALGFYRVLYDASGYHRLRQRFDTLPPLHRWSLLQDLYAFLLAGEIGLERYLDFIDAVRTSTDYVAIVEAVHHYTAAGYPREPVGLFGVLPWHERFQARMRAFLTAQSERLGDTAREGEAERDGILRSIVARALVWNDPDFARRLAPRLADWDKIDPDLRGPVALAYARQGGAEEHARLVTALAEAPDEATAIHFESALVAFRDPTLVASSLDLIGTGAVYRGHILTMIYWASVNPESRAATWDWMTHRADGALEELR